MASVLNARHQERDESIAKGYVAQARGHNWSLEAADLYTQMVRAWINDQSLPPGLSLLA